MNKEMAREVFIDRYWDRYPSIVGVAINEQGLLVLLNKPEGEESRLPKAVIDVPVEYLVTGDFEAE